MRTDDIVIEHDQSLLTRWRIWYFLALALLAISLIGLILMQSRGTSLGSVFGQEGSVFHTRRGAERILFNVSIGVAVGFLAVTSHQQAPSGKVAPSAKEQKGFPLRLDYNLNLRGSPGR